VPATEKGLTIADFLVPVRVGEAASPRLRHAGLVVAGAVLIFLTARISIALPGTPVPFTLQNLGVLIVGGALGLRRGGLAAFLYLAIGVVGLPFFAENRGGLSVIWGTTGGYLVGFVVAAALVGRLAELGWDRRLGGAIGATALGTAVIYAVGVPWLAVVTGLSPGDAIAQGMLPFLVGDTVKLLAAAVVFPAAWWVVGRRPSDR
jgi:biotin transport system substrate-specific component